MFGRHLKNIEERIVDTSSYIVLSRQLGLFRQMDVVANNVANANTVGFKSQQMLFAEFITKGGSGDLKRPVSFTHDLATIRDDMQGGLERTGRPLDAAINGDGFFVVDTPLGPRYTRVGIFHIDTEGSLVNAQGHKIQGAGGDIVFDPTDRDIEIREDGTVMVKVAGGIKEERGKINIVKFEDKNALKEVGNNFFTSDEQPEQATEITDYKVAQGMIENSNVNSVNELTTMIKVNRSVSLTSKFLGDMNDLQRRAISTLSRQN